VSSIAASRQQQIESHGHQAQEFLKTEPAGFGHTGVSRHRRLDSNNVDAQGNLGVLLFFQGATPMPFRASHRARLQPGLSKIQALLGMAEKQTGNGRSALTDLEKAFPKLKEERTQIDTGMQ